MTPKFQPFFIISLLFLTTLSYSLATRLESFPTFSEELKNSRDPAGNNKGNGNQGVGNFGPGSGSGSGFGIPGFGNGWGNGIGGGYGGGYGGPNGGYGKGGTFRPTVVCKEKGPCYMKKLRCPAKCFKSFSRAGKGYGSGGGGGGCTMDCKKKCVAYC